MIEPTPLVPPATPSVNFTEKQLSRFWKKVDKNGPIMRPELTPCWTWLKSKGGRGHGIVRIDKINRGAHRVSWQIANGPIPDELHVLHECDNSSCVNPEHLHLGTPKINSGEMVARGRSAKGDKSGPRKHPELMPRGEAHGCSKLTEQKVREIRQRSADGFSQYQIASEFGIGQAHVHRIVHRLRWAHVV